jgi:hypothetical protein
MQLHTDKCEIVGGRGVPNRTLDQGKQHAAAQHDEPSDQNAKEPSNASWSHRPVLFSFRDTPLVGWGNARNALIVPNQAVTVAAPLPDTKARWFWRATGRFAIINPE